MVAITPNNSPRFYSLTHCSASCLTVVPLQCSTSPPFFELKAKKCGYKYNQICVSANYHSNSNSSNNIMNKSIPNYRVCFCLDQSRGSQPFSGGFGLDRSPLYLSRLINERKKGSSKFQPDVKLCFINLTYYIMIEEIIYIYL